MTYSDAWFVDDSGSTPAEVYDGAPDAESTINSEPGPTYVAGVGVTDADYNSGSVWVRTTLAAPGGATTTATSYQHEWYTRSEVALPYALSPDNRNEEDWRVSTGHYYWTNNDPCYECGSPVGYKRGADNPFFNYFFVQLEWFVSISLSGQGYRGLVVQPPYGVRPFRCLYTQRTCSGSRCGEIYTQMLFFAFGNAVCQEYLQAYFLRLRVGVRTTCTPVYGISTSVPAECF